MADRHLEKAAIARNDADVLTDKARGHADR
jgi:hypothetical protein